MYLGLQLQMTTDNTANGALGLSVYLLIMVSAWYSIKKPLSLSVWAFLIVTLGAQVQHAFDSFKFPWVNSPNCY